MGQALPAAGRAAGMEWILVSPEMTAMIGRGPAPAAPMPHDPVALLFEFGGSGAQAAVRIGGRQAAADALRKVDVAATLDNLNMQGYLGPLLGVGKRPADLASGYRALLADAGRVAWSSSLPAGDEPDPYASHPSTAERIRRIEAVPEATEPDPDTRAASALFADPERWVGAAHERWLQVRGGGGLARRSEPFAP